MYLVYWLDASYFDFATGMNASQRQEYRRYLPALPISKGA